MLLAATIYTGCCLQLLLLLLLATAALCCETIIIAGSNSTSRDRTGTDSVFKNEGDAVATVCSFCFIPGAGMR